MDGPSDHWFMKKIYFENLMLLSLKRKSSVRFLGHFYHQTSTFENLTSEFQIFTKIQENVQNNSFFAQKHKI